MQRKKIGLFFVGSYSWIGGLYYVLNIIKALKQLPDESKPHIVLFYVNNTPKELVNAIDYPFLEKINLNRANSFIRGSNKILRLLFNRNFLFEYLIDRHHLSAIYPLIGFDPFLKKLKTKQIFWIYDFQHLSLPENFTADEINRRNNSFQLMANHGRDIVFSSHVEKRHFVNLYPASNAKLHVLQFVSLISDLTLTSEETLREKYALADKPYFLISNQFWQHKNHRVVVEAIGLLKKHERDVLFVFTGGADKKRPEYKAGIENRIDQLGLTNIKMLGFITREDQLGLMQNCLAVIQPSKYEGWGTVIEDAKALGKGAVLSNIPIHKEQLPNNGLFFNPDDNKQLAQHLEKIIISGKALKLDVPYQKNVIDFGNQILNLFQ